MEWLAITDGAISALRQPDARHARAHVRLGSVLAGGQLRRRAAKFQRLVAFLPATCTQNEKGANRCHNRHSLGVHGFTPILFIIETA